jgi:hypothetical protein
MDYQSKFLYILARCEDLEEKHQINIFTVGLGNPSPTDVELEHPTTLEDVMALLRTGEGDQRGGVNGSQSKFLVVTWPISQNQPDASFF